MLHIAPDALKSYRLCRLVPMKYLQSQINAYGIKSCQNLDNLAKIGTVAASGF